MFISSQAEILQIESVPAAAFAECEGNETMSVSNKLGQTDLKDFQTGDLVAYVPTHADGNIEHPDVDSGIVSSTNNKFVFVKYFPALKRFGWNGTTSQATNPEDLIHLGRPNYADPQNQT